MESGQATISSRFFATTCNCHYSAAENSQAAQHASDALGVSTYEHVMYDIIRIIFNDTIIEAFPCLVLYT